MRKNIFSKVLAIALAGAMVVGGCLVAKKTDVSATEKTAETVSTYVINAECTEFNGEETVTAKLQTGFGGWSEPEVGVEITQEGSYTFSFDVNASLYNLGWLVGENGNKFEVTTVTINGHNLTLDKTYEIVAAATGDNCLRNIWNSDISADDVVATSDEYVLVFTGSEFALYEVESDDTPSDNTPSDDTPSDDTPSDDTPSDDTPSDDTPSDDTPSDDAPEVKEVTLTSNGQVRAENDVYRVNIYNGWTGDTADTIVNPAEFAGANKISVTFTLTGLGNKSGKIGLNLSNSNWGDVQYWFDGVDRPAVVATNVDVNEDGTYTVSVATTGKNLFDTLAFIDLQTDIAVDEGEEDTDITSGINIVIDKIVVEIPQVDDTPSDDPSDEPSDDPSDDPSDAPSDEPSNGPTDTGAGDALLIFVAVAAVAAGVVLVARKRTVTE